MRSTNNESAVEREATVAVVIIMVFLVLRIFCRRRACFLISVTHECGRLHGWSKLQDEDPDKGFLYHGLQYRLLAFWDKTSPFETLVISTHGFIKKRSKVPEAEIQKAVQLRTKYFEEKK